MMMAVGLGEDKPAAADFSDGDILGGGRGWLIRREEGEGKEEDGAKMEVGKRTISHA
jgi:hypothetical protein